MKNKKAMVILRLNFTTLISPIFIYGKKSLAMNSILIS